MTGVQTCALPISFGMIVYRSDVSTYPITNYEAWTDTTVCPTGASASVISFILF